MPDEGGDEGGGRSWRRGGGQVVETRGGQVGGTATAGHP